MFMIFHLRAHILYVKKAVYIIGSYAMTGLGEEFKNKSVMKTQGSFSFFEAKKPHG